MVTFLHYLLSAAVVLNILNIFLYLASIFSCAQTSTLQSGIGLENFADEFSSFQLWDDIKVHLLLASHWSVSPPPLSNSIYN